MSNQGCEENYLEDSCYQEDICCEEEKCEGFEVEDNQDGTVTISDNCGNSVTLCNDCSGGNKTSELSIATQTVGTASTVVDKEVEVVVTVRNSASHKDSVLVSSFFTGGFVPTSISDSELSFSIGPNSQKVFKIKGYFLKEGENSLGFCIKGEHRKDEGSTYCSNEEFRVLKKESSVSVKLVPENDSPIVNRDFEWSLMVRNNGQFDDVIKISSMFPSSFQTSSFDDSDLNIPSGEYKVVKIKGQYKNIGEYMHIVSVVPSFYNLDPEDDIDCKNIVVKNNV